LTDLDLTLLSAIPVKALDARPLAVQDGGGLCSQPDWSVPRTATADPLGGLRKSILSFVSDHSVPRRLREHVSSGQDCPIFADAEILDLRGIVEAWFRHQGWHADVDWSVEAHQPYCLHALHALSTVIQDPDISLFPCLIEGVPTNIDGDIPPSTVFPSAFTDIDEADVAPLICLDNWASAEAEPEVLRELVLSEFAEGLQWLVQLFWVAKPWLHCLYKDVNTPLGDTDISQRWPPAFQERISLQDLWA
ncbi:unnamed protein product, partial [Effrenium voratum]